MKLAQILPLCSTLLIQLPRSTLAFTRSPSLLRQPTHLPVTVVKTDEEWKESLTPDQYYVLRKEGTEPPNSSSLNFVKDDGVFVCAGCGSPLFTTTTKFDSGTGWPSFFAPVSSKSIALSTDFKLGLPRTECTCSQCGGHLGHVFEDGPAPTGQRFCMNGIAMDFRSNLEYPELAESVEEQSSQDPYKVGAAQALPTILLNSGIAAYLLYSLMQRVQATGSFGVLDVAVTILPAVYCGYQAVSAATRL